MQLTTETLVDALAAALKAQSDGRGSVEHRQAIEKLDRAIDDVVDASLKNAFSRGDVARTSSFKEAVQSAMNPGRIRR